MIQKARLALLLAVMAAPARADPPTGFTRLADIAPDVTQDIRYASAHNFTGRPVAGYRKAACWLRSDAAKALAAAQADARAHGLRLIVYDCYRPTRAVAAFVDWARNPDQSTKAEFYPRLDKSALFPQGYIAQQSTHSTGLAVDIGVVGWDFGTPFDFFDKRSWTTAPTRAKAHQHRAALAALMRRHGFENYPREWWHYTFKAAGEPTRYDVEVD